MKELVVVDNKIVSSAYSLTLNEQRLILSAIAKIPKGSPVQPDSVYCVGREDFIRLGVNPSTVAREIREASADLLNRTIVIKDDMIESRYNWLQAVFRFDSEAEANLRKKFPNPEDLDAYMKGAKKLNFLEAIRKKYDDDDVVACLVFTRDVAAYLTDLKENFTQFHLEDLAGFSSTYSVRFYQIIMQFKSTGYRLLTISDLRYMLELKNKYPLIGDLKRWVIDTAIDEINEKSPYSVKYELKKTGRKYTHLELKFSPKAKGKKVSKDKNERDENTSDMFIIDGLTDKQLARLVHSKKFIADYGHMISPGSQANQSSNEWIAYMVAFIKKEPSLFNKRSMKEYLDDVQAARF